jgi:shikimate dehydrogenase
MKKIYGLVGFPLTHSFSASYFKSKFETAGLDKDFEYKNFEIPEASFLPELIRNNPGICGLNVTIPHKQSVLQYMDEVSEAALEIGAINTISVIRKGHDIILKGDNTDWIGFKDSLLVFLKDTQLNALILGTGGSSKAVEFVLKNLDIPYKLVSRNPDQSQHQIAYKDIDSELIKSHRLIINTTPVGMFPKVNNCPEIAYNAVTEEHYLYDLIYNPQTTLFMQQGLEQNASVSNGYEMLRLQAEASWRIWEQNNK